MVFHLGEGSGWYTTIEAKLAVRQGYKLNILNYIEYKPQKGLKTIVQDLYAQRVQYKKTNKSILNTFIKLLLNSLAYGKFAIGTNNQVGKLIDVTNHDEQKKILSHSTVESMFRFAQQTKELWFIKDTSKNRITDYLNNAETQTLSLEAQAQRLRITHATELQQAITKNKELNSAVHLSAFVTAQARVTMYFFLESAYFDNALFYTDTDSAYLKKSFFKKTTIFTNRIDKTDVPKLGKFKLEGEYEKALFLDLKYIIAISTTAAKAAIRGFAGIKKFTQNQIYTLFKKYYIDITTNQGNVEQTTIMPARLVRNKANVEVLEQSEHPVRLTNENVINSRKKIILGTQWIGTETHIRDAQNKEITLEELKQKYDQFKTNIETPIWLSKRLIKLPPNGSLNLVQEKIFES